MFIQKNNTKGFTLVEIMIVVGIIAVLAGIFLVGSGRFRSAANSARIKADLQKIEALQEIYYTKNSQYASDITTLQGSVGAVPFSPVSTISYTTYSDRSCATGAIADANLSPNNGADYCLTR